MKDAKTDSLNKSVHLNVENFVRRVATLGYIGPNADKVSFATGEKCDRLMLTSLGSQC